MVVSTHLQKNMLVKLDHFPRVRDEHEKYLKPPPSYALIYLVDFFHGDIVYPLITHHSSWPNQYFKVQRNEAKRLREKGEGPPKLWTAKPAPYRSHGLFSY